MEIEILKYIPEEKNFRKGFVDIRVQYQNNKWEKFNNVAHFKKDNREWLSMPVTFRDGQAVPIYQRSDDTKTILSPALKILQEYLQATTHEIPEDTSSLF